MTGNIGGTIIPEQFCSFPLVLAYSTLDSAFDALIAQGIIPLKVRLGKTV
jgi:hypothetical protein